MGASWSSGVPPPKLLVFVYENKKKIKIWKWGFFYFWGVGVSHPPRKKHKTTRGPVGIFPEE